MRREGMVDGAVTRSAGWPRPAEGARNKLAYSVGGSAEFAMVEGRRTDGE